MPESTVEAAGSPAHQFERHSQQFRENRVPGRHQTPHDLVGVVDAIGRGSGRTGYVDLSETPSGVEKAVVITHTVSKIPHDPAGLTDPDVRLARIQSSRGVPRHSGRTRLLIPLAIVNIAP